MSDALAAFSRDAAMLQAKFGGPSMQTPVRLVQRPLFNTREGYGSTIVPAVAVLIIQQTLLMGVVLLAGTRREHTGRLQFSTLSLLGLLAAFVLIGLVNLLYFVGFAFWFQDYPRGGNFSGLIVVAVLFITAVVAFALFVGSFFRIREHALQIILVGSLPMFFLANISWPMQATPTALVWLAKLLPSTAGIRSMIKVNQMGAHLQEILPEVLNLLLLVVLYFGMSWWRYRAGGRLAGTPVPNDNAIRRLA
jgi:ABC-2 type transport system permease protein